MRRLLLLILICLLPFQLSWATVADYCEHEQSEAPRHFGHHTDEHEASSSQPDDGPQAEQSPDHDHCHLSGFIGIPESAVSITREPAHPAPRQGDGTYPSRATTPPERPQWPLPA